MLDASLRFEKLLLPSGDFVFHPKRTLLSGEDGASILNALSDPEAILSTVGNRTLLKEYRNEILPKEECFFRFIYGTEARFCRSLVQFKAEVRDIFQALLVKKPWKIKSHQDLKPNYMASGELSCLRYAYIFAIRRMLNLNLPIVIKSPDGYLDRELKQGFSSFLDKQTCQQILFFH